MRIKFNWGNGYIDIDADAVIEMSITGYRRFMMLFAQYGTPEQHKELLDRLRMHISMKGTKGYQRKLEMLEKLVS